MLVTGQGRGAPEWRVFPAGDVDVWADPNVEDAIPNKKGKLLDGDEEVGQTRAETLAAGVAEGAEDPATAACPPEGCRKVCFSSGFLRLCCHDLPLDTSSSSSTQRRPRPL